MAWIFLWIAGLLEVAWAFTMKHSDGFTRPGYSASTLVAMIASFGLLHESQLLCLGAVHGPQEQGAAYAAPLADCVSESSENGNRTMKATLPSHGRSAGVIRWGKDRDA